jgi:hypothetical protein
VVVGSSGRQPAGLLEDAPELVQEAVQEGSGRRGDGRPHGWLSVCRRAHAQPRDAVITAGEGHAVACKVPEDGPESAEEVVVAAFSARNASMSIESGTLWVTPWQGTPSPLATSTHNAGRGLVASWSRAHRSALMKLVVEPESRRVTSWWPLTVAWRTIAFSVHTPASAWRDTWSAPAGAVSGSGSGSSTAGGWNTAAATTSVGAPSST